MKTAQLRAFVAIGAERPAYVRQTQPSSMHAACTGGASAPSLCPNSWPLAAHAHARPARPCLCSVLPSVDAVLLSHHSLQHLGALPYLVASCGLEAPIFATLPVQRMGALTLQDICLAKRVSGTPA